MASTHKIGLSFVAAGAVFGVFTDQRAGVAALEGADLRHPARFLRRERLHLGAARRQEQSFKRRLKIQMTVHVTIVRADGQPLPPGSPVRVEIRDTSLADAPAVMLKRRPRVCRRRARCRSRSI